MQFVQFTNQASLHVPAVLLRISVNFVPLLMRTPTRYSYPTFRVLLHNVSGRSGRFLFGGNNFVNQNVLSKIPVNP